MRLLYLYPKLPNGTDEELEKILRFKVVRAVTTTNTVFWNMTPCSQVETVLIFQSNPLLQSSEVLP
jgi:hypothetical protein